MAEKGGLSWDTVEDFDSGSSGTGWSYYSSIARCPERARMERESMHSGISSSPAIKTGIIFHKFAELYHSQTFDQVVIEYDQLRIDGAFCEAERLFRAYRKKFAPDAFGEVLYVEKDLPENEEQSARIREVLGVDPYTCRIDMVVRNKDGSVWLVDHKTVGAKRSSVEREYKLSGQLLGYMAAWNVCYPDDPCVGTIVNIIVKHKKLVDGSFMQVFVPYPEEEQIIELRNFLRWSKKLELSGERNLSSCFSMGPCPYISRCRREQ